MKKVCRNIEKIAENNRKCLLSEIADICCWNIRQRFSTEPASAYARRKILTYFSCKRRISAIAVSKLFLLFFQCFLFFLHASNFSLSQYIV